LLTTRVAEVRFASGAIHSRAQGRTRGALAGQWNAARRLACGAENRRPRKRTSKDWNGTLDINGHHVAVSARHDASNPEHVSLVVVEGAGSPMSRGDWKLLVKQLHDRMQAQPADAPVGVGGKLWVTHMDLSARQPETNSALFALMAAKDMGRDRGIAEVHADALAELQAMPDAAIYATLERHAADSFMAYAQHGGAAPDLATAAAALEGLRYARMDTAPPDASQSAGVEKASAFHRELMAREREGGLSAQDVETYFEPGRARGTGNVCMFDTLYQLADRAGHGAQLRPFTGGAQGETARAAFGDRMQ
jgi:hypothetical protein